MNMRSATFFLVLIVSSLPGPAWAAADRSVVAVMYFENHSPDPRYMGLSKGLADMMVTDLSRSGLKLVERARLDALLGELQLQKTDYFDPKTAQKIGRGLGATHAVTGSLSSISPTVRLDVRLIEIGSGEILMTDQITGKEDAFFTLWDTLSKRFVTSLNRPAHPTTHKIKQLETVARYGQALSAADDGDFKTASSQMSRVVRDEPSFTLAHSRYKEFVQAMFNARKVRVGQQGSYKDQLEAKLKGLLDHDDPSRVLSTPEYLGYRIVRGDLALLGIYHRRVGKKDPLPTINDSDTSQTLMVRYKDNLQALLGELVVLRKAAETRPLPEEPTFGDEDYTAISQALREAQSHARDPFSVPRYKIASEDINALKDLGLGHRAGVWKFMRTHQVALYLARFITNGHTMRAGLAMELVQGVHPPLSQSDPETLNEALEALDLTLDELAKDKKWPHTERDTIAARWLAAEALLKLKRPAEALASLQAIIDEYPTHQRYDQIEKRMQQILNEM